MGTHYGIGVGPGDPELVTVKALRCMEESDLIVLPAADPAGCHAYQIARKAYPGIEKKELVCLPFPMTRRKKSCAGRTRRFLRGLLLILPKERLWHF